MRAISEPAGTLPHLRAETSADNTIQQISIHQELEDIRNDWNRLSDASPDPNVFMTFDWFRAWNHRFAQDEQGGERQIHVLVIRQGGAVAGIVPLIRRRVSRWGFSVRKLEFTGPQADYNDLALGSNPQDLSRKIAEYLADAQAEWDLVELRDLRDTAHSLGMLTETLAHTGLAFRLLAEKERYPYLETDAPWAQWLARRSYNSRRTFRNQQERLAKMKGEGLRVRILEEPHREPGLLDKMIALESQKRIHGRPMPPLFGRFAGVFQSLLDGLGPRRWLLAAVMELGEKLLAWQLWFRCGGKLWMYQTAYDHTYARLSPGTMLIPAVMDYAFAHKYTELDFLRGEEPYKMRWATNFHQTFRLQIWRKRWASRARSYVYFDVKEAVYRRLKKA